MEQHNQRPKKKILFVCTGNTCRSAMAAALARRELESPDLAGMGIEVASAGLAAWPGDGASPGAVAALSEMGIDLSGHRSAALEPRDVREAALVLAMTAAHRDMLCRMLPGCADKIHTLTRYAGAAGDVPDPFGRDNRVYRSLAGRLAELVRSALHRFARESR